MAPGQTGDFRKREKAMEYRTIELIRDEGIGILYLNRPDALNALNKRMKIELIDALKQTESDDQVRVLILSGRGRAFSAGVDMDRVKAAGKRDGEPQNGSDFGSLDLPRAFIQYTKPIIAAINGPAHGFGFTVTLTCDIRFASEKAKFGCAFVRLGLTPEFCSSYFLPRLIGYGKAAELILTARTFGAQEALEIGAVDRLIPHDELMKETRELALQIAAMPPTAVKSAKQVLRFGMQSTPDQVLQYEQTFLLNSLKTEEHKTALKNLLDQMKAKGS
jgi:2-(1,2-epoxy-1,2-dihydrophenyl)acetyl-CoA isomerase